VTGYGLDDRVIGVRFPAEAMSFLSRPAVDPTQPPMQWVQGTLSLELKRPGHEADTSPPPSTEVKNAWSYTSMPQYVFMAWYLVKHKDIFTFTFTFNF
jgi:hypothetical protein